MRATRLRSCGASHARLLRSLNVLVPPYEQWRRRQRAAGRPRLCPIALIATAGRRGALPSGAGPRACGRAPAPAGRESLGVLAREWLEEQMPDDLGVPGEHLGEQRAPGVGDRDRDAPLVVWGGRARDEARLLEQACLVRQAAAAVDHAVRQVGHAVA